MNATILSLLSAEALRCNYATGYWRDETIYAVARSRAVYASDHFAIRDQYRRLSYRELMDRADALADDLVSHGVRPGERVLVWLPSRTETAVVQLACCRRGYVFCPSPHRNHTVVDVVDLLQRTRCAAFFYWNSGAPLFLRGTQVRERGGCRRHQRPDAMDSSQRGQFCEFDRDIELAGIGTEALNRDPDRVSYLAFTSGSTGAPKGVMHSDNTLLAALRMMAADWRFGPNTVTYSLSPFSHNLGAGAWLTSLVVGGEFVVHDLPRGASLIDRLAETGASYLVGVPTHAIDLVEELRHRGAGRLKPLRCFRISRAAASGSVIEEVLRFEIKPQSGYGMTENCAHQYTRPGDGPRRFIETCDKACAGYEVRIFDVDDADRPARPGEIGEIGGRGASLMLGYFDD